jgi:hypothetical protein
MPAMAAPLWQLVSGFRRASASARDAGVGLAIVLLTSTVCSGGVLTESDLKKVAGIKPLFTSLMTDLAQSSQRTDLAGGDTDCIKLVMRELMQISDELSSYEYLITIESQLNASADSDTTRGIVKFAVDQSNTILSSERKRLVQLSDQCARFPVSAGKTQQALQFIDATTGVLSAIQPRL